jgi:WD40 repeat protein
MYWGIFGFERSSDGFLTEINPPQGYFYCPSQTASDPYDHVAISMQPVNQQDFSPDRLPQLASYTADAEGNLSATSTDSNMPQTSVVSVTDLNISPSGKLLAVGGTQGLEIFHFSGSNPIKPYTGLLTKDEIDQFFWDNQNHLYAISRTANKLYVFTITPTSYSEAPGSPHTISQPQNVIVRPEL